MRIKHRIGQAGAMLGAILTVSAFFYWINGMFLTNSTLSVYNALVYGAVGLAFTFSGAFLADGENV